MILRDYHHDTDREAVQRIYEEIGWVDSGTRHSLDDFIAMSRGSVAELNGAAECYVCTADAQMRYRDSDLQAAIVAGVTTSRIARKQGLAAKLTAMRVADEAARGAAVVSLSMFEQGYYNALGFGTGGYQVRLGFDPSDLIIRGRCRPPIRLTESDYEEMHALRLRRYRKHGAMSVCPPLATRTDLRFITQGFGVGYRDGPDKRLSHFIWFKTTNVEEGPYHVSMIAFESLEQLRELLCYIRALGDQVALVKMECSPYMQIQDLLHKPFRRYHTAKGGKLAPEMNARAYWQVRITQLEPCISVMDWAGPPLRINLDLADPITNHLNSDPVWQGVGGQYILDLGDSCRVRPGYDCDLDTLKCSIGAFTRLWLGVMPAGGLTISDDLHATPWLINALEQGIALPTPYQDWDF